MVKKYKIFRQYVSIVAWLELIQYSMWSYLTLYLNREKKMDLNDMQRPKKAYDVIEPNTVRVL